MSGQLTPLMPALHIDVLYAQDDRGRLLHVRSDSVSRPLAHFFRTATGNHWLINAALPEDAAARLDTAFADEPVLMPEEWEHSAPRFLDVARALLSPFRDPQHTGAEYRGPAYAFPDDLTAVGDAERYAPDGDTTRITPDLAWVATATEAEQPIVVARDADGRIVSLCHSTRSTSDGAEAGLETDEGSRRRGHALAVTSHWAHAVRASGRVPLYSTSWDNEASRAVARRLGLVLYGEDWHLT